METLCGDIFDTPEDLLAGQGEAASVHFLAPRERRSKNCTGVLDLPPLKRNPGQLVGLSNLGATCYLNSFFQVLYLTPELKYLLYSLPLCIGDDIKKPSELLDNPNKHEVLLALQMFFAEMDMLDCRNQTTENVVKTFKWENNEHAMQQDIQEAITYIMTTLGDLLPFCFI